MYIWKNDVHMEYIYIYTDTILTSIYIYILVCLIMCLFIFFKSMLLFVVFTYLDTDMLRVPTAKPEIVPFLAPEAAGQYRCYAAPRCRRSGPTPRAHAQSKRRQRLSWVSGNRAKHASIVHWKSLEILEFEGMGAHFLQTTRLRTSRGYGYSKWWPTRATLQPCFADDQPMAMGPELFCVYSIRFFKIPCSVRLPCYSEHFGAWSCHFNSIFAAFSRISLELFV